MRVLGLYQGGHDMSAAVVEEGRVTVAVEEERLSRVKHHGQVESLYPQRAMHWIRDELGLRDVGADVIAFAEPASGPSNHELTKQCDIPLACVPRIQRFDHHACHIAAAWAWSGWPECHALAIDGGGSDYYGVAARCTRLAPGGSMPKIEVLGCDPMRGLASHMHPGLFYMELTRACGFRPIHDEGKVMCLAARGDPARFRDLFFDRFEVAAFHVRDRMDGRCLRVPLWTDIIAEVEERGADPKANADLCAAGQAFFEEMIWADVRAFIPEGARLVLSGGSFANVIVNRRLLDWASQVFVCPPMWDGGLAAGAALLGAGPEMKIEPLRSVYFGPDAGCIPASVRPSAVAALLTKGKTVGVCQGRLEHGPRALGNRSILADPRDPRVAANLNHSLKRSGFMPFAPTILHEYADEVLECEWRRAALSAEHMTMCFHVKHGSAPEAWRDRVPGVVHVDGTCRPQLLKCETNPFLYNVIAAFHERTGVPCVTQTSFNRHGEPIVGTLVDAKEVFRAGGVDALVSADGLEVRS